MKPLRIIPTADGSFTLRREDLGETYHSTQGALTESQHVYIQHGLLQFPRGKTRLTIAEVGFGTGLNALLTSLCKPDDQEITYYGIDNLPLDSAEMQAMNYPAALDFPAAQEHFDKISAAPWQKQEHFVPEKVLDRFALAKVAGSVLDVQLPENADLVYFDAFGPRYQPEIWEPAVFEHLSTRMAPGAILVTYCARGQFRRTLESLGWAVERLPGPVGLKKEMIRARCPI